MPPRANPARPHRELQVVVGGTGQRRCHPAAPSSLEVAIDDVIIRQVVDCEECCDGDINQDGNVDQDDTSYLIQIVAGGENPVGTDPDFNRDGNVDQDDVLSYINFAGGAGCP